jgi:hypothetical protein
MTTIFLQQRSGKIKDVTVDLGWPGEKLILHLFEITENEKKLSLDEWLGRYCYLFNGKFITPKCLSVQGIEEHSTIKETLKSHVRSPTEKWNEVKDPTLLAPGCRHIVSQGRLRSVVDPNSVLAEVQTRKDFVKQLAKIISSDPRCWFCREKIDVVHVVEACAKKGTPPLDELEAELVSQLSKTKEWFAYILEDYS